MIAFRCVETQPCGAVADDGDVVVGVIFTAGRVLHVAAGRCREDVEGALAAWVRKQAPAKLRGSGSARAEVERLLAGGMCAAALEAYLRHVSSAWDPEWAEIRSVPPAGVAVEVAKS